MIATDPGVIPAIPSFISLSEEAKESRNATIKALIQRHEICSKEAGCKTVAGKQSSSSSSSSSAFDSFLRDWKESMGAVTGVDQAAIGELLHMLQTHEVSANTTNVYKLRIISRTIQ